MVFIGGQLNTHWYIDEILKPILLPLINQHARVTFQQNNASPHIANIIKNFLYQATVKIISWPARSPDLNLIEYVWNNMGSFLRHLPGQANALEKLSCHLPEARDKIAQEEIDHVIRSMPCRTRKCIDYRRHVTHY